MKGIITLLVIVYATVGRAQLEQCPKEQEIDWGIEWLLRHDDCEKFYKCTFGKPVPMSCPSGLWFNLNTWRCDWPQNVDCEDRNIPGDSTTSSTTTTTTTPSSTTLSTTTTTTTPPSTTPSTTTTTTPPSTTPSTTTTTTPPSTTPSTTTTTTPPSTTPSTTTTTTTMPTPVDFLPNGCPVNPLIHWLLPHPTDCNAFYYCVWGDLVLRHCPANLHFNRTIQVCDWPWAAGCPASFNKHLPSRQLLR